MGEKGHYIRSPEVTDFYSLSLEHEDFLSFLFIEQKQKKLYCKMIRSL